MCLNDGLEMEVALLQEDPASGEIDQVSQWFPIAWSKYSVGCTACFICSPHNVHTKIPIERSKEHAQILSFVHNLKWPTSIALLTSLPSALPSIQPTFTRRTSGHFLGIFKARNISAPPPPLTNPAPLFYFISLSFIPYQRGMKRQEAGENCIMRNFITCTLLQV
jgi:hypothetical protein